MKWTVYIFNRNHSNTWELLRHQRSPWPSENVLLTRKSYNGRRQISSGLVKMAKSPSANISLTSLIQTKSRSYQVSRRDHFQLRLCLWWKFKQWANIWPVYPTINLKRFHGSQNLLLCLWPNRLWKDSHDEGRYQQRRSRSVLLRSSIDIPLYRAGKFSKI